MASITEMSHRFADYCGIPVSQAKTQWTNLCKFLADSMAEGKDVTMAGVGTMSVKYKAARTYNDPRNGGTMVVEEHYIPHMKFTNGIKKEIREKVVSI